MELPRFRGLLALGAVRWRRCLVTRAAVRPAEPVTAPDGTPLTSHEPRPTTDDSVVGHVRCWRHDFTARGQEGIGPLDAALSLPARGDADLLREGATDGTTDASYRESQTVLARILGLPLSLQAREPSAVEAGREVDSCEAQPAEPTSPPTVGTILGVQAEGQGVPMVQPPPTLPPVRLGKGQQRTQTQAAVVTGLYTMAPSQRPPPEVVAALWQDSGCQEPVARPRPVGKERRATLEGKAVAMAHLVQRVVPREGPHIEQRVALTDGAEALPQPLVTHVPAHPLVLDMIHATASRWDTANALQGETHPGRTAGVRTHLEPLLAGQTAAVIAALEAEANEPTRTATPRQAVRRPVGSDQRHQPSRHDATDLARGGPSGTGGVAGACGHLVQDRLEPSGMRWTTAGAQAVRDRRAVRLNGPWDASGQLPRHQQHQRVYGTLASTPERAETQALTLAA